MITEKNIINGSTRPATRISDWKKLLVNIPALKNSKTNNRHYWTIRKSEKYNDSNSK